MIVLSIGTLASLNGWILLLVLIQVALLAANPLIFSRPMQKCKMRLSDARKVYNFRLTDFIEGVHAIKTYLCAPLMQEKADQAAREVNQAQYKSVLVQMYANLFSMTAGYLFTFLIVGTGVYFIYVGKMTAGSLLAVMQITDLLANPAATLSYYINSLLAVRPVKQKLDELAVKKKEEQEETGEEDAEAARVPF